MSFLCTATVNLLQPLRLIKKIMFYTFYSNAFSQPRPSKIMAATLHKLILPVTRRSVLMFFIVPGVPICKQNPEKKLTNQFANEQSTPNLTIF